MLYCDRTIRKIMKLFESTPFFHRGVVDACLPSDFWHHVHFCSCFRAPTVRFFVRPVDCRHVVYDTTYHRSVAESCVLIVLECSWWFLRQIKTKSKSDAEEWLTNDAYKRKNRYLYRYLYLCLYCTSIEPTEEKVNRVMSHESRVATYAWTRARSGEYYFLI